MAPTTGPDTDGATIFHNPKCSTSRKALDRLRESGVEPTIVKYLDTPPTRAELVTLIAAAGIEVTGAVRRREPLFAELGLADASDDELLDAMVAHPRLIERPFVVTARGTRLARPLDRLDEIL
ncbi:MAG: arsenate reductase (glutaredoxin) [Corynebacteriales bacterium]|nr:arsenate reductase (glutaredoxin) [Mycobacteriales bacterium]